MSERLRNSEKAVKAAAEKFWNMKKPSPAMMALADEALSAAAFPVLVKAAKDALHYMRLHKYADQAWADDLEAALVRATGETDERI